MMMIYGMFVFELRTLPHQQLQQNNRISRCYTESPRTGETGR